MTRRNDAPIAFGVPRLPPGVIERPRLAQLLDQRAPLTVVTGAGGRGKTTLVAHWIRHQSRDEQVVWIDLASVWRHGESPWLRILEALGDAGLISAKHVARDVTVVSERPDEGQRVIRRGLASQSKPVLLVLDGMPVDPVRYAPDWAGLTVDLVRAVPAVRCIVMGRSPEVFGTASTRTAVETVMIDDAALALTQDEAAAMIARHDGEVDRVTASSLAALVEGNSAAELRYLLVLMETTDVDLERLARGHVGDEVTAMVRRDLAGAGLDDARWMFIGQLSFAPAATPHLARELTGDVAAEEVLEVLVRAGVGQWTSLPHVGRAFRASELLRSAATSDLIRDHPRIAKAARSATARWLLEHAQDPLGALREALDADDMALVERALIHVYPLSSEEPRAFSWIDRIPAHRVHRRPLLALARALRLNASSASQARASAYFVSATVVGELRGSHAPYDEHAIRLGLESLAWRMLGREQPMVRRARQCVEKVMAGPAEGADRPVGNDQHMTAMMVRAIYQSALGLMSAGLDKEAADAFLMMAQAASTVNAPQFVNVAQAGTALVQALKGEIKKARITLANIDGDAWPDTWLDGYMEAPHLIARAWVHLHEGEPARALECVLALDAHADTIEFWGLMVEARVLALAWLGRPQEAEFTLRSVRSHREGKTTLPLTRARLDSMAMLVDLVAGTAQEPPRAGAKGAPNPFRSALVALNGVATGDTDVAMAACLTADAHSTTPQHHAMASVAGIAVGHRTGEQALVARYAARLSVLIHDHEVTLPTALLTNAERVAALAALPSIAGGTASRRQDLESAFKKIDPLGETLRSELRALPDLTASERELLTMLAGPYTRAQIAQERYVSINTVKTQLRNLYAKLGTSTRDEAVARAVEWGLMTRKENTGND